MLGGCHMSAWDQLRAKLKSISEDEQQLDDRMAKAVADGWLTEEQSWWIQFGKKLEDDSR